MHNFLEDNCKTPLIPISPSIKRFGMGNVKHNSSISLEKKRARLLLLLFISFEDLELLSLHGIVSIQLVGLTKQT